ncbi:MAG TPA: cupredoxin domain-containing protein [Rhodocyclaceae bacterium]|nr:cupredoxin domain-containing protein [Rhodocyclaceae bacterium]
MKTWTRRRLLGGTLSLGAATLLEGLAGRNAVADPPPVIDVEARRFRFTPAEIPLKAGQAVELAIRSVDFVHGFSLPDLGLRTDLPPGRVTRVALPPLPPGTYDFLCDNFCGDGHEEMHGRLIVRA